MKKIIFIAILMSCTQTALATIRNCIDDDSKQSNFKVLMADGGSSCTLLLSENGSVDKDTLFRIHDKECLVSDASIQVKWKYTFINRRNGSRFYANPEYVINRADGTYTGDDETGICKKQDTGDAF